MSDGKTEKIILERLHSRSLGGMLFTAILCFGLTGAGIAIALTDKGFDSSPLAGKIVGGFFLAIFGLVGILMMKTFVQKSIKGSRVLHFVRDQRPGGVTNVEFREIRVRGGRPAYMIFFKFEDGGQEALTFPPKQKQDLVEYVRATFPHLKIEA